VIGLSRTCRLEDFPGCETVAAWQQHLADCSWEVWTTLGRGNGKDVTVGINWSGCPFTTPGPCPRGPTEHLLFDQPLPRHIAAVFGLSVLDHIEAPAKFVQRAAERLCPQGLLFLTFAFWDAEGDDHAAGHEHRRRIYNNDLWKKLIAEARRAGLKPFGGMDWSYHGHKLGDHTLASLVLIKREREMSR
jgi:hypothetical protein